MRIDGFSPQSYPIKRKPPKALTRVDDSVEDVEVESIQPETPVSSNRGSANTGSVNSGGASARAASSGSNFPVRQQDISYQQRSVSSRVAQALASYLSTASFVDWDALDVEGLDLHV